jgi:hypothetical protein
MSKQVRDTRFVQVRRYDGRSVHLIWEDSIKYSACTSNPHVSRPYDFHYTASIVVLGGRVHPKAESLVHSDPKVLR